MDNIPDQDEFELSKQKPLSNNEEHRTGIGLLKGAHESELLKKFEPIPTLGSFGNVCETKKLFHQRVYANMGIALRELTKKDYYALQEANTLENFKHSGIVRLHDSWIEGSPKNWQKQLDSLLGKYLEPRVMFKHLNRTVFMNLQVEFCVCTLRDWHNKNEIREWRGENEWLKQLASSAPCLHQMNNMHQDLQPNNILSAEHGHSFRIKVCGIGIVTRKKHSYSNNVDIFSLGLIHIEIYGKMDVIEKHEVLMSDLNKKLLDFVEPIIKSFNHMPTHISKFHVGVGRLYRTRHGFHIELFCFRITLPAMQEKDILKCFIADRNALYFIIERYCGTNSYLRMLFKVVFLPHYGLQLHEIRELKNDETLQNSGLITRVKTNSKQVYRLFDDSDRDAVQLPSGALASDVLGIHRKIVFFTIRSNLVHHICLKRSGKTAVMIVINLRLIGNLNPSWWASDSSRFFYFTIGSELHTVDTDIMTLLPPLRFGGLDTVRIYSVCDGKAILLGKRKNVSTITSQMDICLPVGYFESSIPTPLSNSEKLRNGIEILRGTYESAFLKKFEPLAILGVGGYGCVFEVKANSDHRVYAVKRIALKGNPPSPKAIENALKEVKTLRSLNHDGIVRIKDAWFEISPHGCQKELDSVLMKYLWHDKELQHSDHTVFMYIQMEFCVCTLRDWLSNNKIREWRREKEWFKQLVSAVSYLHQMNKIHRDLKPNNILFAEHGNSFRIKICDLGLVANIERHDGREVDSIRTMGTGTKMYMAPEQQGDDYGEEVDIFCLGCVLAEIVKPMTVDEAYQIVHKYRSDTTVTTIIPDYPEMASDRIVTWLAQKEASKRPTCQEILQHEFLQ